MRGKIAILSAHKSYDYRIYRHIRSLLKLGWEVHYYNITNEKNATSPAEDPRFVYIPMYTRKKFSLRTFVLYFNLLIRLLYKEEYDYYFLQDEELLLLFLLAPKKVKKKVVIDSHEILSLKEHKLKRLLIKLTYSGIPGELACITAVPQNCDFLKTYFKDVCLFENYPLYTDFFKTEDEIQTCEKLQKRITVIYFGMITEENRQMLKTLDVMELLIKKGIFQAVLIGPIANRAFKTEIENNILRMSVEYPALFRYTGPLPRSLVVKELTKADILLSLYNFSDEFRIAPNKIFEALAVGLVIVTNLNSDALGLPEDFPEDFIIKVEKAATAEEIANVILRSCDSVEGVERKKREIRKWFETQQLFWEKYDTHYNEIFRKK